jgi:polyhydroxyalkanoate synthesis regulator phasin
MRLQRLNFVRTGRWQQYGMLVVGLDSGHLSNSSDAITYSSASLAHTKTMPGFGDIVQKAFYLGVGLASYAGEKATGRISELRSQVQKLADEMVARGEMSTEEARRLVEEMMKQAQQQPPIGETKTSQSTEPRRIEILEDDETTPANDGSQGNANSDVDSLRDQVKRMQEELRRLQKE